MYFITIDIGLNRLMEGVYPHKSFLANLKN